MAVQDTDVTFFSSKQMKAILKISDCELMHLREAGKLEFIKKGNAYFYRLPAGKSVLDYSLGKALLNWHCDKHRSEIPNVPKSLASKVALENLIIDILLPLQQKFKSPKITYGFTSHELKSYIARNSSKGTAPELDQHSSFELNSQNNMICSRGGAACDFYLESYSMSEIVIYIVNHLPFDRLYFFGEARPIHVSVNIKPMYHLQIMHETAEGRRYPGKKAFGKPDAICLAEKI